MSVHGKLGHFHGAFKGPGTTYETASVHKVGICNTRFLLKFFLSESTPVSVKRNALSKRLRCRRHCLNSVHTSSINHKSKLNLSLKIVFFFKIKQCFFPRAAVLSEVKEFTTLMELFSLVPSLFKYCSSRHRNLSDSFKSPQEFFLSNEHSFLELSVLAHAIRSSLVIIPITVKSANASS